MATMPQPGGLGGAAAPNPDDLLAQIRALLDQYLALGDTTPVAAEAQNLAQAIDATAGAAGGAPPGAPPPPGGIDLGAPPPGDPMAPQPGEPPANPDAKTFKQGNVSALARLEQRNKKKKTP